MLPEITPEQEDVADEMLAAIDRGDILRISELMRSEVWDGEDA